MSVFSPRALPAPIAPVLACALIAAPPAQSATGTSAKEAHAPVIRVAVADGASGRLTVHHAASGRRVLETELPGPASSLVTLGDNRHLAAAVGAKNAVQLIDGGSWTEPHDDHTHSFVAPPAVVGEPLASERPSHVVAEGDEIVIFGDGAGSVDRYSLAALVGGGSATAVRRTVTPHHGVGVPFSTGLLVSSAPASGARPDSVVQLDAQGRQLARFDGCPGLHGETSGADWAAFGCVDGTLLVEGSPLRARKLAYPAGLAGRVGTWNRTASGRHLVGAYGTAGLLIVDRRSGTQHLTAIDGLVHAAKTDGGSSAAFALTRDGKVHRVAAGSGQVRSSAQAIEPFTSPAGVPTPKLAVAGGRVAVSSPARGTVTVLRASDLRVITTFRVAGTPTQVALLGDRPHDE